MINKKDSDYIKLEDSENSKANKAFLKLLEMLGFTENEIIRDVKTFYSDYGKDGVVTFKEATKYMRVGNGTRVKRLLVLFYSITHKFNNLHTNTEVVFDEHFETIIEDEFNFVKQKIVKDEISKIKNQKWGVDELNWKTRLTNNVKKVANKVCNEIKFSITTKKTIKQVEKKINKVFDSFKHSMKTLLFTETVATASTAKLRIAKLNGYKYYYWIVKPDACSTCIDTSGTFPIQAYQIGVTAPPLHPHCRCIVKFIKNKNR